MGGYYDEIEIEDMSFDPVKKVYHYPCPCGDRFEISKAQLRDYEDVATCPSCSLIIRVIFDPLDYEDYEDEEDDGELQESSQDDEDEEEGDSHSTSESKATGLTKAIQNLKLDHETVEPRGTKEDIPKDDPDGRDIDLMGTKGTSKIADAVHIVDPFVTVDAGVVRAAV
ncbi:Diphthamide biosynthesis protein 3 [Tulasnella sp. JGI-2019a]|nr:Diphthamide biosynthesis protein 3 [Tulasnella sp. JGI-2019a]